MIKDAIKLSKAVAFIVAASSVPLSSQAMSLKGVDYQEDDFSRLTLQFDSAVEDHSTFATQKPSRIVIDVPGAKNSAGKYHKNIDEVLSSLTVLETAKGVRVVANLNSPSSPSYQTEVDGNELILTMDYGLSENKNSTASSVKTLAPTASLAPKLKAVEFDRTGDEGATLSIATTGKGLDTQIEETGRSVRLFIKGVRVPDDLHKHFNAEQFNSVVTDFKVREVDLGTEITINMNKSFTHTISESGNAINLSFVPKNA